MRTNIYTVPYHHHHHHLFRLYDTFNVLETNIRQSNLQRKRPREMLRSPKLKFILNRGKICRIVGIFHYLMNLLKTDLLHNVV